MVSVGTKSLLFGAHWPPHIAMVALAWRWLYGQWPTPKELAAICLHDIGYWGVEQMDGHDGTMHPWKGAKLADRFLGPEYGDLIRGHSKGYVGLENIALSKLYAADKLAVAFEPSWLYCLRTRLSGELQQYRECGPGGAKRLDEEGIGDRQWFRIIRARMIRGGLSHAITLLAPEGIGSARGR
jgi:hypothetical protein